MDNNLLVAIWLSCTGIFCLLFTNATAKFISLFAQISKRLEGVKIEPEQTWARPAFIRLIGAVQIGLAAFVYFRGSV